MWMLTTAMSILMMTSSTRMAWIKNIIERTTAEKFSENFFWISKYEAWKSCAKYEIRFEWIVSSSAVMMTSIVVVVVSY
jgi:hypothetical protein